MSAFSVSDLHLQTLVATAERLEMFRDVFVVPGGPLESARLLRMLRDENNRSIEYRYTNEPKSGPSTLGPLPSTAKIGIIGDTRIEKDPIKLLKLVACYEYQACETPEWKTSAARGWCEGLRHRLIRSLPGYEAAPWGI